MSILLKEIRKNDLQIGNGNSCCEFEFTRTPQASDVESIICVLEISQETNPYDMTMNVRHLGKFMKKKKRCKYHTNQKVYKS